MEEQTSFIVMSRTTAHCVLYLDVEIAILRQNLCMRTDKRGCKRYPDSSTTTTIIMNNDTDFEVNASRFS